MTNTRGRAAAATLAALVAATWFCSRDALAGVSVHGSLTQEQQVTAGETYSGTITLVNTGGSEEPVKIYSTDYLFYRDGTCLYGEPGGHARSNAGWLTFEPHETVIPPGATASLSYTVAVPEDQALLGTYWSVLMVEVPGNAGLVAADKSGAQIGIDQILRYGVQVVTNIEDSGERQLDFVETKVIRDGKQRSLQLDLENTGERWLRPALWTELYDTDGNCIGKFDGGSLRIYPGTSVRFKIDLSAVEPGEYKAVAIADCGADDIFGAAYTLRFEDENLTRSQ
jgi:hypothetical protein